MVVEDISRKEAGNIVNSVRRVFRHKDINHLTKGAYRFISLHMDFIAHYDLYGFRSTYTDLRDFASRLQTSEYSNDRDYNLRNAEREERENVALTIREIVKIASESEDEMRIHFGGLQREKELSLAGKLAGKYGYRLEEEG